MSKRNLMLVAFGLILGFQMQAQTLEMMKKAMAGRGGGPAFSFFKDEALSMPMEAVMDGDTRFFVKVKIDKSKVQRLGSYAGRPSASLVMKVGSFNLYRGKKEFGKSLMDIAKNEGFVVYEVDLNSEDGDLQAFLNSAYAEETKLPINLSVEVVKYKRVAEGSFVMDLSRGKSKYLSAGVQSQGNYAFNYTDEFSDAKHKKP